MRYESIVHADIAEICDMYEEYLNKGDYIREEIRRTAESPEFIGVKAMDGDVLAGVCYGTKSLLMTYPHPELEAEIKAAAGDRRLFSVDAMIVRREYRAHNVSAEMLRQLVSRIRSLGYRLTFSEMWIYPDGDIPVAPLFEHLGRAVYEKRVEGFYSDLEKYGLECPLCGKNCTCAALLRLTEV